MTRATEERRRQRGRGRGTPDRHFDRAGVEGPLEVSCTMFQSSEADPWQGTLSIGDGWICDPACTSVVWVSLCGLHLWACTDEVRPAFDRVREEVRCWEYLDREAQYVASLLAAVEELLGAIAAVVIPTIRIDDLAALDRHARAAGRREGRRALAADFRRLIGAEPSGEDPGMDESCEDLDEETRSRLAAGEADAREGRVRRLRPDELEDLRKSSE